MRFAIKGTDPRFPLLRELLLADGHTLVPEAEADAQRILNLLRALDVQTAHLKASR